MPAQKREIKRNYIGLVSDEAEQQLARNAPPLSSQPMKDFIRGLFRRDARTAQRSPLTVSVRSLQKLRCARNCRCTAFWSLNS
jgi:hypothetical protein